jgi:MacB-like periplasmic core domain
MLHDRLREATRSLIRDRRFSGVAVALVAVTIGVVTAVYAIVHAVVLRPFPFADQDRLIVIWQRDDRRASPVVEVTRSELEDWRARSRSFEDLAVVGSVNWSLTLVGPTRSDAVSLSAVSSSFFTIVGTRPSMGRGFEPADEDGPAPARRAADVDPIEVLRAE